jgi:uncharacterized protein (TIGR02996 family)
VTTEEDFQAALDADPADWQTRLVFADWLQERGDTRADGYRALGRLRLRPVRGGNVESEAGVAFTHPGFMTREEVDRLSRSEKARAILLASCLPDDWVSCVPQTKGFSDSAWDVWRVRATRRAIEDAAALAFAKLPPDRQCELLAAPPATPAKKPRRPKA